MIVPLSVTSVIHLAMASRSMSAVRTVRFGRKIRIITVLVVLQPFDSPVVPFFTQFQIHSCIAEVNEVPCRNIFYEQQQDSVSCAACCGKNGLCIVFGKITGCFLYGGINGRKHNRLIAATYSFDIFLVDMCVHIFCCQVCHNLRIFFCLYVFYRTRYFPFQSWLKAAGTCSILPPLHQVRQPVTGVRHQTD